LHSWNDQKNKINRNKHGVSFETASLVFDDPLHITRLERIENGEQRWQTIGTIDGVILMLVAHTWTVLANGEENIHIISARHATRIERKIYEQDI